MELIVNHREAKTSFATAPEHPFRKALNYCMASIRCAGDVLKGLLDPEHFDQASERFEVRRQLGWEMSDAEVTKAVVTNQGGIVTSHGFVECMRRFGPDLKAIDPLSGSQIVRQYLIIQPFNGNLGFDDRSVIIEPQQTTIDRLRRQLPVISLPRMSNTQAA